MPGGISGLTRLWRDRTGVVATEFALFLPMLVAILIGSAEIGRLVILTQKVQNGAFFFADLIARNETIDVATLQDVFLAVGMVLEPFDFSENGKAIVTVVSGTDEDGPVINWQQSWGVQTLGPSAVGAVDLTDGEQDPANLPAVLSLGANETLVVTEVFFAFEPLFGVLIDPLTVHRVAYHKPRLGTLETLDP